MSLDLQIDDVITKHIVTAPRHSSEVLWTTIASAHNAQCSANICSQKINTLIQLDHELCNAIDTLSQFKQIVKEYGASEALMKVFNEHEQLSDAIGVRIPTITTDNARIVGDACIEGVDMSIAESHEKINVFFNEMCSAVGQFFDKFSTQSVQQSVAIYDAIDQVWNNIDRLDVTALSANTIFGYTQPVFMNRLAACQFIATNLSNREINADTVAEFTPQLRTLGYKVVESALEHLNVPVTYTDMSNDDSLSVDSVSVESIDAVSDNSMNIVKWTPGTIRIAAYSVKNVLDAIPQMSGITAKLCAVRDTVCNSIKAMEKTSSNDNVMEHERNVASGRAQAAFIGNVITIFGSAINELVDQTLSMLGRLRDAIPEEETPVTSPNQPDVVTPSVNPTTVPIESVPEQPVANPEIPEITPEVEEPAAAPVEVTPSAPLPSTQPTTVPIEPPVPAQEPEAIPETSEPNPIVPESSSVPTNDTDDESASEQEKSDEEPDKSNSEQETSAEDFLEDTIMTKLW